jgi:class 3 adenylate cyclase
MILRSPKEQAEKDVFDLIVASALVGGLLALLAYHLFMFATYRNRNYLLYSLFIASTALFTLSFTSYHRQLLPATMFGFAVDFWWSAGAAQITSFCMYLFSSDLLGFLPTKTNPRRRLARFLLVLPIMHVLCLVLIFATDNALVLLPVRLSVALDVLLLPTVAAVLWLRDRTNKIAIYYAISWIPFVAGVVTIVCWLSGVIGHHDILPWSVPVGALAQSLLLSLAASQRLKNRDRVITAFVSPDVVSELDRGEDPMTYHPRNVEKCIVFLDMHDYTKFSESLSTIDCHDVLNQYFEIINKTTYTNGGRVDKIIGDAMMVVFDDPRQCLTGIVELRRNISDLNRRRTGDGLQPIKFGVGISYGTMLAANFGSNQKLDRTLVGDTVNVASRLETITRAFAVDVMCSREFVDQHPGYQYFRPAGYVLLKGRQKKSLVYELFEHNLPEVVAWKASTRPTLLKVIDLELHGQYVEAIAALQSLVDRCPPHSFKSGQIMDPTLLSMINAIEEKMRQLGLAVPPRNMRPTLALKEAG